MYCTECGANMPEGTKFCTSCGAPLQSVGRTPTSGQSPHATVTPTTRRIPKPAEGPTAKPSVPPSKPVKGPTAKPSVPPSKPANGKRTPLVSVMCSITSFATIVFWFFCTMWVVFLVVALAEGQEVSIDLTGDNTEFYALLALCVLSLPVSAALLYLVEEDKARFKFDLVSSSVPIAGGISTLFAMCSGVVFLAIFTSDMEDSFSCSLFLVSTMTFVAEAVIFSRIAKKWGVGNSKKK